MSLIKRSLRQMFGAAMQANLENIERVLRAVPAGGRMLDLGCDDGARSVAFAAAARAAEVHGIELSTDAVDLARARGVSATRADLNRRLPVESATFDVVVSNQVLEHLIDTDTFVSEIRRVLVPGGIAVVSTENLASWHNALALIAGWQPFSLGNVSERRAGLGNPLAIHRGSLPAAVRSWQHVRVFAYRGLRELFEAHGLTVRALHGAGYFPFPAKVGRLEPRHAAFLAVEAFKSPAGELEEERRRVSLDVVGEADGRTAERVADPIARAAGPPTRG